MNTFLAITTLFLAVRNLKRISPLTSAVPAILGSITKQFSRLTEGGNIPVVIYFKHSIMVYDRLHLYSFTGTVFAVDEGEWMSEIYSL